MLSEINDKYKNTLLFHLYVESKKLKFVDTKNRVVLARGSNWEMGEVGEMSKGGQEAQSFS